MRGPGDEVGLRETTCACVLSNSWGKFLIIYLFSSQANQPKTLISQSKGKEIDKLRQSLLADSATKTDFVSVFNFKSTYNLQSVLQGLWYIQMSINKYFGDIFVI